MPTTKLVINPRTNKFVNKLAILCSSFLILLISLTPKVYIPKVAKIKNI